MNVPLILTNVAILFVVATIWTARKEGQALAPAAKTWLTVAAIFAAVSIVLTLT